MKITRDFRPLRCSFGHAHTPTASPGSTRCGTPLTSVFARCARHRRPQRGRRDHRGVRDELIREIRGLARWNGEAGCGPMKIGAPSHDELRQTFEKPGLAGLPR